ncbi:MAG: enoyl-CoA hydratase-related protein [Proteobacteria bacterium]|nr:enoyl-CoA hydratase-related protein [Pseudomonadota bacterium]
MATDHILVGRDGSGIVTVTLNRPEELNALTKSMWGRLGQVFRELSIDDSVRCIVITGAGEKSFSPGNDISEFETDRSNSTLAAEYGALMQESIHALETCPHPLVAMIKGICVGGGLEIAGLCDLRICGASSRFGAPIAKLGLVMGYAEIGALRALVGPTRALEILLEGRIMDADEAFRLGIVSRVVADGEVEADAMATAGRIAAGAPLVHRWHKKFLRRLAQATPLTTDEIKEGYACYDTEDFRIGYRAFLDKTTPVFDGR